MTGKFPLSLFLGFVMQCFGEVLSCLFSTKVSEAKKPLESKPVDSGAVGGSQVEPAEPKPKGLDLLDIGGHKYRVEINVDSGKTMFFKRGFAPEIRHHALFGRKVFPSDNWDWVECFRHEGTELTLATMSFIKSVPMHHGGWVTKEQIQPVANQQINLAQPVVNREKVAADKVILPREMPKDSSDTSSNSSGRKEYGDLMAFGVREFPDREKENKKYTAFAIILKLKGGREKSLIGEGLKDAIAESGVEVGDFVSVQRLEKIPVQLMDKESGKPVLNADGSAIFKDKQLWQIKKRSR